MLTHRLVLLRGNLLQKVGDALPPGDLEPAQLEELEDALARAGVDHVALGQQADLHMQPSFRRFVPGL